MGDDGEGNHRRASLFLQIKVDGKEPTSLKRAEPQSVT